MSRKISDLVHLAGDVYIYVPNKDIEKKFLEDAEEEGYTFGNGFRPTGSLGNDLYRIYKDMTLCHVNFFGHAAFDNKNIGSLDDRHYIDYGKYIGEEDIYDDFRKADCNAKTVMY